MREWLKLTLLGITLRAVALLGLKLSTKRASTDPISKRAGFKKPSIGNCIGDGSESELAIRARTDVHTGFLRWLNSQGTEYLVPVVKQGRKFVIVCPESLPRRRVVEITSH
jgi:hypothetical protein